MGASLWRRAFTLVELMIVIAIIGILVALLIPAIQSASASVSQARCAENLHRLWQAVSMRAADEAAHPNKRVLRATAWPAQVLPYLESGSQFMVCPAGGESMSEDGASGGQSTSFTDGAASSGTSGGTGSGNDWANYAQLSDLADFMTVAGSGTYIVPLEEGRWCLKLSDPQYDAARSQGLLNNDDSANNIRDKFNTAYQPGSNPHSYWLCLEDHGGDEDYKDVMMHVIENRDGSFSLDVSAGSTGHKNSIVNKPEGAELTSVPSNASGLHLTVKSSDSPDAVGSGGGVEVAPQYSSIQADDPVQGGVVSNSYAMNAYYPQMTRKAGKILLVDYIKYLVYVNDDWAGEKMDPEQTGSPLFARHGGRMNVLYGDGSVAAENPQDIDPVTPKNEWVLWRP
jgi:prepilin-type N-terminal cleavage/methylation domain-containing protein/prepilin-type processing-associated H-X9-DG protein